MRTCARCKLSKEESNFYPRLGHLYSSYCKPCHLEKGKLFREKNPGYQKEHCRRWYHRDVEASRKRNRERRAANKEARRQSSRRWVCKNPGWWKKYRGAKKEYVQKRLKNNPEFKLIRYLRTRLYHALKSTPKSRRTLDLLGASISEVRAHLESGFRPGMTWKNYGPVWHVDHIKPCAKFDLTDPAQQRVCFHYTNLQPLFARENLQKGAK